MILVEDEPLSRDVITRMLAYDGHQVNAFASGQAAIDHLHGQEARNAYEIALVDGNLPDLTGLATADRLRELWEVYGSALPPIVLMTAQVTDEHLRAQRSGRIDRVIQKPITMTTIRSLLGVASATPHVVPSPAHAPAAFGHLQVYLDAIRQNFEDRHWSKLEAAAHKLAGAAMTLDMPTLGDRSLALETAARAKDRDRAALILAHLESLLAHVGKGP